jgi:signal transduction histidine kinase
MLENIFDPYFTTKHRSDMHSGTGLGLFIAHQNVQDHGGTIEVDSRVREGTTFTVTLPAKPPAGFPSSQQD